MNHGERSAPSIIAQPTTYRQGKARERSKEGKEKKRKEKNDIL